MIMTQLKIALQKTFQSKDNLFFQKIARFANHEMGAYSSFRNAYFRAIDNEIYLYDNSNFFNSDVNLIESEANLDNLEFAEDDYFKEPDVDNGTSTDLNKILLQKIITKSIQRALNE